MRIFGKWCAVCVFFSGSKTVINEKEAKFRPTFGGGGDAQGFFFVCSQRAKFGQVSAGFFIFQGKLCNFCLQRQRLLFFFFFFVVFWVFLFSRNFSGTLCLDFSGWKCLIFAR